MYSNKMINVCLFNNWQDLPICPFLLIIETHLIGSIWTISCTSANNNPIEMSLKPRGFKDLLVNEIIPDKPRFNRQAPPPREEEKKYGRFASNKEWTRDKSITVKASNDSHFHIKEKVSFIVIPGRLMDRIVSTTGFR
jgi:hypothetical protein